MNDDTHDKMMLAVISYLNASEDFENSPSVRSKRSVRRELRELISLAKLRQTEVAETYEKVREEHRAAGRWEDNKYKNLNSKKKLQGTKGNN